MYEPDTSLTPRISEASLHFMDCHLVLTSCPTQGSSALGGMIQWSQPLNILLESALTACPRSLVASGLGRSNLNHYVWTYILH